MLSMMTVEAADKMSACWQWDVVKSANKENRDLIWSRIVSKLLYKYKTTLM